MKALMLILLSISTPILAELSAVIQTKKGPVRGVILQTIIKSVNYTSFKGIPYAKPPTGYRRFKPPEEIDAWTEILNATTDPSDCPQMGNGEYRGDEDCLYLNVHTPKTKFDSNDDDLLPVMVWIYGGAFSTGTINSTVYGADFLIEDNVIMVAMNYRVGPLGFLSLNHVNATGNAGLKDQLLALKWVRDNIKEFGGDPNKVTIFGQSAGSVSVELHTISEKSRGLYRSSIAMSGSPLNPWGFYSIPDAVSRAFHLGRELGLITISKKRLLQKLYDVSAEELISAAGSMVVLELLKFKPTYENEKIAGDDAFITECAVKRYKAGKVDGLPHMLGFTRSETNTFAKGVIDYKLMVDTALDHFGEAIRPKWDVMDFLTELSNKVIEDLEELGTDIIERLVKITTDLFFVVNIDLTQQYWAAASSSPVYYYRNSFDYDTSIHRVFGINLNGTGHVDDLGQIFWIQHLNQSTDPNSVIGVQRTKMVRLFTNFAKYGDPTPDGTNDTLLNVKWIASGSEGNCLEIGDNLKMEVRPTDDTVKNLQFLMQPFEKRLNGCPRNFWQH